VDSFFLERGCSRWNSARLSMFSTELSAPTEPSDFMVNITFVRLGITSAFTHYRLHGKSQNSVGKLLTK
jgi:hypothetical protein